MLHKFKYLLILLFIVIGCQYHEDVQSESLRYTFDFGIDVQTRATPLTPDEQRIKSLFVALYDDKGEFIDCLVDSSGKPVTFNVSQSRTPTTVYALANVTSNGNYAYFYDKTTELDFGRSLDELKPYFSTINDYNRVTLSHRSTSGILVAPTTTPLPMAGTAKVSKSTTSVAMQLAVARFDIIPQGKAISSVTITNLINSIPLNPATLGAQQSDTTAGSSIVVQFPIAVNTPITYYIPGNYGNMGIDVAVNGEAPKSFSRMLANKYYSLTVGGDKPIEILPEASVMNFTVDGWVVGGGRTQTISLPKAYQAATLDVPLSMVESYKKNTTSDKVVFTLTISENTGLYREGFLNVMFEKKSLKTYVLVQEGSSPIRPVITLKYGGRAIAEGSTMSVGAKKANYQIEFQEDPRDPLHTYKMRYKSGDTGAWWKTGYIRETISKDDELFHDCREQNILIEENFGAAREVEVEIYRKDTPDDAAYLTFKIAQAQSTDYLTLSSQSLQADKWGNVYLYPEQFNVSSNQNWTLVNNVPGWVTATYIPGTKNQPVVLSVDENLTGSPRTGTLDFMVGGVRKAQYTITQSATQSASRPMRFKLNLELHTTENKFKYVSPPPYNQTYYVKVIDIWNHNATTQDISNQFSNGGMYGFVTDAPASFNTVEAKNLEHQDFIITNYNGSAKTVSKDVQLNLMGDGATGIFREIQYHIPYPAGVQPNQIVVVNVRVDNIQGTRKHDPAIVTTTVEALPKR